MQAKASDQVLEAKDELGIKVFHLQVTRQQDFVWNFVQLILVTDQDAGPAIGSVNSAVDAVDAECLSTHQYRTSDDGTTSVQSLTMTCGEATQADGGTHVRRPLPSGMGTLPL
jgi:hypothetical protein